MQGRGFVSALATVLRGAAVPYGYTLTVWTSGMMLTRERGVPTVGEVFLFMAGAVVAFVLLGSVVTLMRGVAFEPIPGNLRRVGMVQFLAVGIALGAATLVALIHSGIAWPLGAFVATATYLGVSTVELTLAKSGRRREDDP